MGYQKCQYSHITLALEELRHLNLLATRACSSTTLNLQKHTQCYIMQHCRR